MQEEKIKNIEQPENNKKKKIIKKILFLFLFIIILFYVYIRFIEPNMLLVHEYPIIDNNLPAAFDGTKIIHFSDILYGTTIQEKNLDKIVTKINELKGDIVVFTGDLLNDTIHLNEKDYSLLKEKLKNIQAKYRKYAIIGNVDTLNISTYKDIMESAGFIILDNKNELLYFNSNDPLMFIGTTSLLSEDIDIEKSLKNEEDTSKYYKIWLSHEPTILDTLQKKNITPNLLLAGHTLHGLVRLPFDTCLLHQEGMEEYKNAYYEIENTKLFITNGLGTYKYNIRFNNIPSINLYRLYSHL